MIIYIIAEAEMTTAAIWRVADLSILITVRR